VSYTVVLDIYILFEEDFFFPIWSFLSSFTCYSPFSLLILHCQLSVYILLIHSPCSPHPPFMRCLPLSFLSDSISQSAKSICHHVVCPPNTTKRWKTWRFYWFNIMWYVGGELAILYLTKRESVNMYYLSFLTASDMMMMKIRECAVGCVPCMYPLGVSVSVCGAVPHEVAPRMHLVDNWTNLLFLLNADCCGF